MTIHMTQFIIIDVNFVIFTNTGLKINKENC